MSLCPMECRLFPADNYLIPVERLSLPLGFYPCPNRMSALSNRMSPFVVECHNSSVGCHLPPRERNLLRRLGCFKTLHSKQVANCNLGTILPCSHFLGGYATKQTSATCPFRRTGNVQRDISTFPRYHLKAERSGGRAPGGHVGTRKRFGWKLKVKRWTSRNPYISNFLQSAGNIVDYAECKKGAALAVGPDVKKYKPHCTNGIYSPRRNIIFPDGISHPPKWERCYSVGLKNSVLDSQFCVRDSPDVSGIMGGCSGNTDDHRHEIVEHSQSFHDVIRVNLREAGMKRE